MTTGDAQDRMALWHHSTLQAAEKRRLSPEPHPGNEPQKKGDEQETRPQPRRCQPVAAQRADEGNNCDCAEHRDCEHKENPARCGFLSPTAPPILRH